MLTTREFLKTTGAFAGMCAGGSLFGANAPALPKVRLAAIGTGGRGHTDLHAFLKSGLAEITCAADVFDPSLAWVRKEQPKARIYKDYKKMLRECAGTYDAVSIMTPDHIHCVAFLEAAKYNVPVYCAKPLGHTIAETLAMMRVAREKKLITHVSHHGNSEPGTPTLREWMESGVFGRAVEAHVYCNSGSTLFRPNLDSINHPLPVPKGLDWELWQGPAKHRPYFDGVAPRKWRSWTLYGEGCVGDWCCHLLGPLCYALHLGLPKSVTMVDDAAGFDPAKTPLGFPLKPHYLFEYAMPDGGAPFFIHWYDCYRSAPRPAALEANLRFNPVADGQSGGWLKCEKATMMFGPTGVSGLRIVPFAQHKAMKPLFPPKKYPRIKNHWAEFLQAVQQKRQANTSFEVGGTYTLMGLMATISTRFPGKRLMFDPVTLACLNEPKANAWLRPEWNEETLKEFGGELRLG